MIRHYHTWSASHRLLWRSQWFSDLYQCNQFMGHCKDPLIDYIGRGLKSLPLFFFQCELDLFMKVILELYLLTNRNDLKTLVSLLTLKSSALLCSMKVIVAFRSWWLEIYHGHYKQQHKHGTKPNCTQVKTMGTGDTRFISCCLAAIVGASIQHPCHAVKSLKLIWRLGLTHGDRDKMAAISQMTLSNAFCEWKW